MKSNRRDFLRLSGLAGISMVPAPFVKGEAATEKLSALRAPGKHFNMSGYAAPKIDTVRIGFIGLGQRGPNAVERMNKIEGVDIKALCDIRPEKAEHAKQLLNGRFNPQLYTGGKDDWKKLCERPDIDLVYIATPWSLHTPMAVYAMKNGKHVCVEVPAAKTVDECWELVETSEATKKHCMMLENCCYDFFELLTLNLARNGYFGEIVHGEGGYVHDLLELNFKKTGYYDMWRLRENYQRNGCLYPTHGLGPVAQVMNINRGDKMDYLVSLSTKDFQMAAKAKELAATDDFFKQFADKNYRGNMNTTVIKTAGGRSINIQHDVTSTNVYSRIHFISGTNGSALKYPEPGRISQTHTGWISDAEMKELQEKYEPAIVKKVGELAKKIGGHGGMDFLMDWRTIDCLRNGLPLDMDCYDAAAWSSVGPLSEKSLAKRSSSVDIPDFTAGDWKTNKPVDITLSQGANTNVIG
jgi:predicted dehydrogenase